MGQLMREVEKEPEFYEAKAHILEAIQHNCRSFIEGAKVYQTMAEEGLTITPDSLLLKSKKEVYEFMGRLLSFFAEEGKKVKYYPTGDLINTLTTFVISVVQDQKAVELLYTFADVCQEHFLHKYEDEDGSEAEPETRRN